MQNLQPYQNIITDPAKKNSCLMIKGPTGAGKSTILLERYRYMVEELCIPSSSILILLLNRTQSLSWRTRTVLKSSGAIMRTSFYGFIQSELKAFYPLVLQKCPDIKARRIKPVFLTFESSQFLLSKVIEKRREKEGLFTGLTAYTDKIAIDLTANLVKAAVSDIPHDQIGQRLYQALEKKDPTRKKVFEDADLVTQAYRDKCMELGVFDFGMAISLYNQYLIPDETYRRTLTGRIRHILVDDIQECVPTEVDFMEQLLPHLDTCMVGYNPEGGYGEAFGGNHDYMMSRLYDKFKVIDLARSYTCNNTLYEFSEMLFDNMEIARRKERAAVSVEMAGQRKVKGEDEEVLIERNDPYDLRSDMLEGVGQRIIALIEKENYQLSDITVLSTYADPVTEYVIGSMLEKQGYFVKNMTRKSQVTENPFTYALMTLAQLCHPAFGVMPGRDDVKALLRLLLKIDPVRSSILAQDIVSQRPFASFPDLSTLNQIERVGFFNTEKYTAIREWIEEYKAGAPLPIHEFFQKVFLELLISQEIVETDILQAKNLIDSAKSFVEIVEKFMKNPSSDFVKMLKKGVKAAESIFELEEKMTGDFVLLSTPVTYLASSMQSKVLILTSLSSENWFPRNMKELTNNQVLTKTWDPSGVYTEEMEEDKQLGYLARLVRALIKRCGEKLITFESTLSANGFENYGSLSIFFDNAAGGTGHGT